MPCYADRRLPSVCIISVLRIFTLRDAVMTTDPTWDNTDAAFWSVIELHAASLASSLPTLRPLLAKIVPGLSSRYNAVNKASKEHQTQTQANRTTMRHNSSTEEFILKPASDSEAFSVHSAEKDEEKGGKPLHSSLQTQ
jgi:hypothetical protein